MSKVPYEVYTEDVEALSVLSPDGEIVNKDKMPELSDDQLKEIMYRMVFTRTWDDRAVNLGRQRASWILRSSIRSRSFHDRQ